MILPAASRLGSFTARLEGVNCQLELDLELDLDGTGCLSGTFTMSGERFEVMGGVPNALNEVLGLIRKCGGDTLAVFRATPRTSDLMLELDVLAASELKQLIGPKRLVFNRVQRTEIGSSSRRKVGGVVSTK